MTGTERQKFLAERMTGLGGSDAAAIIGENPWKNAIQVWNEKMGMVDQEMNEAMRWGIAMEPLIRDGNCCMTGRGASRT